MWVAMQDVSEIGVVAIGRNEGERLRRCLLSLQGLKNCVYVDSGSTDGSQALARELGFDVVQLVIPPGFTAARARNEGLQRLLELQPALSLVQMVDGDCEVAPGWIETARQTLAADPQLAAVFGRRRERFPEASVYNMLCDDEWDVPVGEAAACGGDAMFRVAALTAVGGYSPDLIAGEEPDMCLRMGRKGWRIRRIDAEMTLHDAAIMRFSQWWKRTQRGGHAFAELTHRHGRGSNPHWPKATINTFVWAGIELLCLALLLAGLLSLNGWLLAAGGMIALLLVLQTIRLALRRRREGMAPRDAAAWGFFIMLGKLPQLHGMLQYGLKRLSGQRSTLIEYKA